jgi:hypothetical protein
MPHIYRRVRETEFEILRDFILSPHVETLEFEKHKEWQEKALEELRSPNNVRVAFAAFQSTYSGKIDKNLICGCIFLKCSQINNTGELKNLVTTINETEETKKRIKSKLVEKAIKFCEQRDFYKVEIELLQNEMQQYVHFFLELDFQVSHLREKYHPGKFVYILDKQIGSTYQGDPFNIKQIIRWFSRTIMPNVIMYDIKNGNNLDHHTRYKRITFKKFPETVLINNNIGKNLDYFNLIGDVCYLEEYRESFFTEVNIRNCFYKESHFKFLIVDKITTKLSKICKNLNIKVFNLDTLKKISGGSESSLSIPIRNKSSIRGVVTVLEQNKIINYLNQKLIYFLVSGIGEAIDNSVDNFLVFFCPQWKKEENVLIGYAKIEGTVEIPKLNKSTYTYFNEMYPNYAISIEETDYEFYKRVESKNIKVIKCSEIQIFKKFIPIDSNNELNFRDKYYNYLYNELSNKLSNSVYIDEFNSKKLIDKHQIDEDFDIEKETGQKLPKVFISYSHKHKQNPYFKDVLAKLKKLPCKVYIDDNSEAPINDLYKYIKENYDVVLSFFPNEELQDSKWIALETGQALAAEKKLKENFEWVCFSLEPDFIKLLQEKKIEILDNIDLLIQKSNFQELEAKNKKHKLDNYFRMNNRDLKTMKKAVEKFITKANYSVIYPITDPKTTENANKLIMNTISRISNLKK